MSIDIEKLVHSQQRYFASGRTRDIAFRKQALSRLESAVVQYEERILSALNEDLQKSHFEGYMTEIGMVKAELSYVQKRLVRWNRPQRVKTPLAQFPAKSVILREPYGSVLIMAPWNYPFQLCLEPLIGALAAGNCAVIKPSAYAPHTAQVLKSMIEACFPPEYVAVVPGGRSENLALLDQPFQFIFFTGGATVGRFVMEKAARHLTPVCLELGGKSPCIVDSTANVRLAAKRIVFGKCLNAGQTCVAPDYVLVDRAVKDQFCREAQRYIEQFYTKDPLSNPAYPRIINQKHFDRLVSLMEGGHVLYGGHSCAAHLQIEPTLIDQVSPDSPLMAEEIFGPLLPILTFSDRAQAIEFVNARPHPLALYLFTSDKAFTSQVLSSVSFGGGCVNDTIIHLATSRMGFGGVGASGMGQCHGRRSFDAFTHEKSIVKKATWLDLPIRYQPATRRKMRLMRRFLK